MRVGEPRQIDPRKLGSNLGQLSAENGVKRGSVTQSQVKRINEIAFLWLFRDHPRTENSSNLSNNLHCNLSPTWVH